MWVHNTSVPCRLICEPSSSRRNFFIYSPLLPGKCVNLFLHRCQHYHDECRTVSELAKYR